MSNALDGVVVVDLTTEFFTSITATLLGDFGAKVIRVENTGVPRPAANRDGMHPAEAWDSHAELAHRNKQSVALDLEVAAGRQVLEKLLAKADVLVTDLPFKTLEAKGLDYESLCALREDIILARGSGFGPKGPDCDLPALDELAAARVGLMRTLGEPDQPPVYSGTGQMHTAVMLAFGTVLAMLHRAETGEGQIVDASLFAGNMYAASLDLQAYLAVRAERILASVSRLDMGNPMSGPSYPCSDGRWVTLAMPDTDRWWPIFSEIIGLEIDDPRFDSHAKRCEVNRLEMMRVLDERFSKQPGSYWEKQFAEKQVSADLIETYDFPVEDPQARVNRYILELDHPSYGQIKTLGFPIYMSESPARLRSMAPCRGQHTEEILQDFLGMSEAQVAALEAK
ncbi:MAG: CoA transferase [Deltaproteobacteria bacterium]|nr:CoA transferase [Deltaproteobacteria bacterium]